MSKIAHFKNTIIFVGDDWIGADNPSSERQESILLELKILNNHNKMYYSYYETKYNYKIVGQN